MQTKSFSLPFLSKRTSGATGVQVRTFVQFGTDEFGRYRCLVPSEVVSTLRHRNPRLSEHPDILMTQEISGRTVLTCNDLQSLAEYMTFLFNGLYTRMTTTLDVYGDPTVRMVA